MKSSSEVGMIRFKRCTFARTTVKVIPRLSIVSFVLSKIRMKIAHLLQFTLSQFGLSALPE